MADPQRIVLVRLSHLGDVVHALPVYQALRNRFESARIAWVVQPEFADLVRPLPGLERAIEFGRRDGARAWWRLRGELRAFAPELAVDAQGNIKSAVATWLTRARRRVGLHPSDWREPIGARVLTETAAPVPNVVQRPDATPHAMDRMLALARYFDAEGAARHDPELTPTELEQGRAAVQRWLVGPAPVVLALGDPADPRSWPLEHHAQLARELCAEGRGVVLLSGPSEREHGTRLARELGDTGSLRHWVGQRGLRELAAFFTAAADHGAHYIGADSGPMHLAAACGLPVIALAGPQSHWRTGPWPPPPLGLQAADQASPHRVLRSTRELECAPCLARQCRHPEGPICMTTLDPDRVRTALAPS